MFTGIVQAIGRVAASTPRGDGVRVAVATGTLDLLGTRVGDSVAVNGCCLTVVAIGPDALEFDASAQTLLCTTGFAPGAAVNLELALRVGDPLGGHLMSGHVDGVGIVAMFAPVAGEAGSARLEVDAPAALAPLIAVKGSVAVAGVSLTVNEVRDRRFAVNLIPHTLAATTLRDLDAGARVNLEADQLARYVARLREFEH
ncbi:MAG: riboflavin synthase [Casimicrobiaceae bacterium]